MDQTLFPATSNGMSANSGNEGVLPDAELYSSFLR